MSTGPLFASWGPLCYLSATTLHTLSFQTHGVATPLSGYNRPVRSTSRRAGPYHAAGPARWLSESERLYLDFRQLTPYRFKPFARTFETFAEYERWKRAQTNPWYR